MKTKKEIKNMIKKSNGVKKIVLKDYLSKIDDYEEEGGYLKDVIENGCKSGICNGLIYYTDTIKFFKKHKEEIKRIIKTLKDEAGWDVTESNDFDNEDLFCEEDNNRNLLAWMAYEEATRELLDMLDISY